MSDLPKRVLIDEEGPREGFQSEKKMIPVADKVRLIEALADTGLRRIACVSYVNPKRVPTMADAEEVAARINRKPGIQYSALWLNQQGLERALRGPLHVDGGVRITASDTFSRKNIGKSVPDALIEQRLSLKTFKDRGMPVEWGVVLGAFGCNYEGELSTELILQRVQSVLDEAELAGFTLKGIKLTDAMGWATPQSVERLIGAIRSKWPALEIALHLHDTRGTGMASAYAGLRLGVTKFDASIAGLGGCPFAATDGAAGNICTEDFAFLCEEMGVATGLDIDRLIEVAQLAEEVVGRALPGHVMRGGTLKAAKQKAAGQRVAA
ncbi:MAG TPA: hydroxymethylglutaryl-CoA lyase [Reyranella sp.]